MFKFRLNLVLLTALIFLVYYAGGNNAHNMLNSPPPPVPSNDDCANAITLTVGTTCNFSTYSNDLATPSSLSVVANPTSCEGSIYNDVWFKFTVPANGDVIIDTRGDTITPLDSNFNMGMMLYTGACGSLTVFDPLLSGGCIWGGNFNTLEMPKQRFTGLTPGTVIYIRLWTFNNTTHGTFGICVSSPTPPVNDECVNAISISCSTICNFTSATLLGATISSNLPMPGCSGSSSMIRDVWFKTVVPASGKLIVDTRHQETTDAGMAVYRGTCGALTNMVCDDNTSPDGLMPLVARYTGLTPGETVYIRVWASNGRAEGLFDICAKDPLVPTNDDCINAIEVFPDVSCTATSSIIGSVESATASGGAVAPCIGNPNDDVWFKFVAQTPSQYISLTEYESSPFTYNAQIFSGTCGGLTPLTDCLAADVTDKLIPNLTVGNTYYIRVYTTATAPFAFGSQSMFRLCVKNWAPPPVNDECSGALDIVPEDNCVDGTSLLHGSLSGATNSGLTANLPCFGNPDDDVWYSFIAINDSVNVSISQGDTIKLMGQLYSGTCGSLTALNCFEYSIDWSNPASTTTLVSGLIVGQRYFIRIYSWDGFYHGGNQGDFILCLTNPLQHSSMGACSPSNQLPNDLCNNATPICNLDGYCGVTDSTYLIDMTPQLDGIFCTGNNVPANSSIDNNSWLKFMATDEMATFNIYVSNCVHGAGIQVEIYESPDCLTFIKHSNCFWSNLDGTVTAYGLIPGQIYYIMIDGIAGDVCHYLIRTGYGVSTGINAGPDVSICNGQSTQLSANQGSSYIWTPATGLSNPNIANPIANPTVTTTYIVSSGVVNPFCPNSTDTVVVTVLGGNSANATSNSPVCLNGTIQLNESSGGTSYQWSGPGGFTSNISNPSRTNSTVGFAGWYKVTVTYAGGCSAVDSVNVVIGSGGTANITTNSPLCEGSVLNIAENTVGVTGWNWSGPAGFISNSSSVSINNITVADAGTYSVTITLPGGCTNSVSTIVVVNPLPMATLTAPDSVCVGSNLSLSASGGISYNWSGPGGYSSNSQNPIRPVVNISYTGNYIVTVTGVGGCTSIAQKNIQVVSLPIGTTTPNLSLCLGNQLNLVSSGGGTYNWTGPNGFTSNLQNPTIPSATVSDSGRYTVVVTGNAGCTNSFYTDVIVNNELSATVNIPSPICSGSVLNITTSTIGTSYLWSGPNGYFSNLQNDIINPANITDSGIYSVTVTLANGCSAIGQATATVVANLTAIATSPDTACFGTNVQLSSSGGISYQWTGPNGFNSALQNPILPLVSSADSGFYSVIVFAGGCSDTAQIHLTVISNPTISVTSNISVCEGDTINLHSSGGNMYHWSGPNAFDSSLQNPIIVNPTIIDIGTYTVTVTSSFGCTSTGQTIVHVNLNPTVTIIGDTILCIGESTTLVASGGNSYNWSNFVATNSNIISPIANEAYVVTVTSSAGCSNSAAVLVTVNSIPQVTQIDTIPELCSSHNGSIHIIVSSGNAPFQYSWNNTTSNYSTISNLSAGSYTVTITDNSGCTVSTTILLSNIPKPNISLLSKIDDHCSQGVGEVKIDTADNIYNTNSYTWSTSESDTLSSIQNLSAGIYTVTVSNGYCLDSISVTINNIPGPIADFELLPPFASHSSGAIQFSNTSIGGTYFYWNFGDGANSVEESPNHIYTNTQSYNVVLTVVDLFGCTDSVVKPINIIDDFEIYIPNTFTPDGDGINDVFSPKAIGYSLEGYQMIIYNRWGQEVFFSNSISTGWNGKIEGHKLDINAVFAYKILIRDLQGKDYFFTGHVTLLGASYID